MSEHSEIEWTDATWNPVRGCTKITPGCDHCYAETFAERFRGVPGHPGSPRDGRVDLAPGMGDGGGRRTGAPAGPRPVRRRPSGLLRIPALSHRRHRRPSPELALLPLAIPAALRARSWCPARNRTVRFGWNRSSYSSASVAVVQSARCAFATGALPSFPRHTIRQTRPRSLSRRGSRRSTS